MGDFFIELTENTRTYSRQGRDLGLLPGVTKRVKLPTRREAAEKLTIGPVAIASSGKECISVFLQEPHPVSFSRVLGGDDSGLYPKSLGEWRRVRFPPGGTMIIKDRQDKNRSWTITRVEQPN